MLNRTISPLASFPSISNHHAPDGENTSKRRPFHRMEKRFGAAWDAQSDF
jgi:hypothetical protein